MSEAKRKAKRDRQTQRISANSSRGKNSLAVTPKDVGPEHSTSRDITERNIASDNIEEREEAILDDALELTFPASDPISVPSYDEALKRNAGQKNFVRR